MTPWTVSMPAHQLLEFTQTHTIESVMPSNYLILCHPLLLLPSIFPSIRVISSESVLCIRWPKYWRFSIRPSKEYSGPFPLGLTGWIFLQSKGLLSLLQHHSSKAPVFQRRTFIHDYWKNHSFNYMDLCQQSNISDF